VNLQQQALLDTDVLSAIMRRNPQATERASLYFHNVMLALPEMSLVHRYRFGIAD